MPCDTRKSITKNKGPTFELLHRLGRLFLRARRILSCVGRILELPQDEWHLRMHNDTDVALCLYH